MPDNDTSTSGVSPEQLARLLGIGLNEGMRSERESPKVIAELLRARLDGTLPLDESVVDALPVILGRLSKELAPLSGKSLGEVLLDPETDLAAVKTIKDYAKRLAMRKRSAEDHAAAISIYYAAIASALLYHDEKITQHSYADLASSFDLLIHKPWMVPELDESFSKARELCQQKAA